MSDDMLICFDSPAAAKTREKIPNRNGLRSPLIPCPSTPFDLVSSRPGDDPFELEPQDPYGMKHAARFSVKTRTPERSLLVPLMLDVPAIDAATPSPLLLRRAMSDVDISGVVPGQYLVSSTPLVSNANTPTRASHTVPRRSVLCIDESISCALVKSKLDFINKVNQKLAFSGGIAMNRSKSISNLPETLDTSVQHKIFSSSKSVVRQERSEIPRERCSTKFSLPMNSSKANCSSFMFDQDETIKHETSTYLSFLTSPKHLMVNATPSPEKFREEAKKMQIIFSLCATDNYIPTAEEEGCEWVDASCFPDAWFDDSLDFDSIHANCDSDEDVNGTRSKRMSTQEEMEAIKIRLNRFRRSAGPGEDKPVKESKEVDPIEKNIPAPLTQPEAAVEVEAAPVVAPPVVVPKMQIVPELRSKAPNAVPAKKGPLKAVEPVPNMVKKSLSTDLLLKTKPSLARGRQPRPSSEQGPRRQTSPTSRRSNSISPNRSAPPPVKNLRLPAKQPGIKTKTVPATGRGKENRV